LTIRAARQLAAPGISVADTTVRTARRFSGYPFISLARIGQLAVNLAYQRRKLGGALLWDAIQRSLCPRLAVSALVADADDDDAVAFYRHQGFVSLRTRPLRFVLPFHSSWNPAVGSRDVRERTAKSL
jgi:ribosomal protein S18 acetylase RimI-like enzyme